MRKIIFTIFSYFLLLTLTGSFINAQTFDHNTGTLQVTVFDNGYLGHDAATVPAGNGVVFSSNIDACFTSGIMYGNFTFGVSGMVGSFTDVLGNPPLVEDCVNLVPITSGSTSNFDQTTFCQFNDGNAPVPYGVEVTQESFSNTGDDFIFLKYTFQNGTGSDINDFYAAFFSDWDIGGASGFPINRGDVDVSRNLVYQWEDGGANDASYYGLIAFDGIIGGTTTSDYPGDATTIRFVLREWIGIIVPPATTPDDHRSYIGSGPYELLNNTEIVVGIGIVAGTDLPDLESNTDAAQVIWDNVIIPVELTSFTASVNRQGEVILNWSTATEVNNQLFEIERRSENGEYITIGYVDGYGTTTEPQEYSYVDRSADVGKYFYRLKQIDFQGTYEYSDEIEIDVKGPLAFELEQNYPNPFNPSTTIKYGIPEAGNVRLAVYNLIGEEVALLADGYSEAGFFEVNFDASNLPSGAYFYKLQSQNSVEVKKMLLTK